MFVLTFTDNRNRLKYLCSVKLRGSSELLFYRGDINDYHVMKFKDKIQLERAMFEHDLKNDNLVVKIIHQQ